MKMFKNEIENNWRKLTWHFLQNHDPFLHFRNTSHLTLDFQPVSINFKMVELNKNVSIKPRSNG